MDISLNDESLSLIVNERITEAIGTALGSYEMTSQISKTLSEQIATGAVALAIKEAVAKLDTQRLVTALAKQIERTVTAATVSILRDSFVGVISNLRGIKEYGEKRDAKIAAIRAELGF